MIAQIPFFRHKVKEDRPVYKQVWNLNRFKSGKIPNHDNILNAVRMPSWKWNTHSMHGLFALFGLTFCTGFFKHIADIILDRARMPSCK